MQKKKIWAKFQRIIEVFTQTIVTKLSKIWVWDPRSGIRKKPIPDPGSRGQKGTGSRIRIRNTDQNDKQTCTFWVFSFLSLLQKISASLEWNQKLLC
jgi:hypothetical protein